MALLNFDASQVAPSTGSGDPIPAGWYPVMVTGTELKKTKDNETTGNMRLATELTVVDGHYKGRKIFTGFNIRNANPTAQEIAYKELSALCHAVGVLNVQDSQQLHGIPLKVKVKVKPASGDYEAGNDVSAYKNWNEVVDLVLAPVATPGATTSAPAGFGPPAGFPQPPVQQGAPAGFAPAGFAPPQAPQAPQQFQQPQQAPGPVYAPPQGAPAPQPGQWAQPAAAQPWAAPQQPQMQPQQPQFAPGPVQQPDPTQPGFPVPQPPMETQGQPNPMQQVFQQPPTGPFVPQQQAAAQQPVAPPDAVAQQAAGQVPPWMQPPQG